MLKIFNKYYSIRNLFFFLGESGLIFLVFWSTYSIFYHGNSLIETSYKSQIWLRIIISTIIIQASLYYNDLYEFKYERNILYLSLYTLQAVSIACIVLVVLYYLSPQISLELKVIFFGVFPLLVLLVSWRIAYQYISKHRWFNEKVFLIGDGRLASLIYENIHGNLDSGYNIAAIFSNPGSTDFVKNLAIKKHRSYHSLCEEAEKIGVKKIIFAVEEKRGHFPIDPLLNCKMKGIKIYDGLSFYELLSGKILATQTPPSWLIFSEGFRRHKIILMSKRCIDVFFAIFGFVASAPLIFFISIAIRMTSQGPIFLKQVRVGEQEKTFLIFKFRTMREDAETSTGAVWAFDNDPRITKVGSLLRKLRLDELPQFWNVIKGDMSFVGPRPERPEFVEQLKNELPYYGQRHSVKPGITGWAQINYGYGASVEDALHKLEYDLFYIKNLSFMFDFFIVLKTIKAILKGEGVR